MREPVLKTVAALMVVVFPLSLAAADLHAAMMQVSGMVLVNGVQTRGSTAIFAGDKIQTEKDAAVNLTVKGSTVMLLPESGAVYGDDGIELASGTVVVSTQEGMRARVQNLVISPARKTGKFQVTRSQGELLISALRGAVSIAEGGSSKMVNEGGSASVPDPAAPAPAPVAGGGGLSTAWAVGIGLAVAAAAAGIAIGTTGTPSSPAHP